MSSSVLELTEETSSAAVAEACRRIAPLWPLHKFVAVNPFLGLSDIPFNEAARLMERVAPGGMLMRAEGETRQPQLLPTVAEWLDQTQATQWAAFVTDEISKWCASYFDRGQSVWPMPWAGLPLWEAWKKAAELDANPEVFGLSGFRHFVRELPNSLEAVVEFALDALAVPPEIAADFLHRELMSVYGWSAYAAYQDWGLATTQPVLRQLLAIRLVYDVALLALAKNWRCDAAQSPDTSDAKCQTLAAREQAFRHSLIDKLRTEPDTAPSRKALQAIFCIDVRSEVYRRALESQSPTIATTGFAGFFGMPVTVSGAAHCPVLLQPQYTLQESCPAPKLGRLQNVWKKVSQSAVGCFPAVEVTGSWFSVKMLQQWAKKWSLPKPQTQLSWEIPLSDQIDLAAGALKNMSLDVSHLAPVVLICGHGSQTENNPYAASLDCGACGGHKGDANARFAAALLNDPAVRSGLRARGLHVPEDTVFIAGLHITTTDDVILFDTPGLSPQQRSEIVGWLEKASRLARQERHRSLQEAQRSSVDWSEVRPEWGLAGNAAFIAAPRARTQGADLQGRVFLHDYDPARDADASVLTLILTAPVIVASWINLQYYASTVNNRVFGSGNKVLHNVVGGFGIWEGNGGDLRTGLPIQSLHDGTKWMHEPLRLQVFVEAPRDRIDRVLQNNQQIVNLVENEWLYLLAIEGTDVYVRQRSGHWALESR